MSLNIHLSNSTALLIIDVQKGFRDEEFWGGNRSTPDFEQNVISLLTYFRSKHLPIIHVKHNSTTSNCLLFPTKSGNDLEDFVKPTSFDDEPLFEKNVNSAFIGTDLEKYLRDKRITTLILIGLTTNHCCETTARMASNLGFIVYFVRDATATFDRHFEGVTIKSEEVHRNTLANLNEEFATIVTTKDLLQSSLVNMNSC